MLWSLVSFELMSIRDLGAAEQCFATSWGEGKIVLAPDDHLHVQLSAENPAPTGYRVHYRVYSTLDELAPERWDTKPLVEGTIPPGDPGVVSIAVAGVYKVRICVSGDPSGAATTAEVDAEYRKTAPLLP